jgi:hypothetical protein
VFLRSLDSSASSLMTGRNTTVGSFVVGCDNGPGCWVGVVESRWLSSWICLLSMASSEAGSITDGNGCCGRGVTGYETWDGFTRVGDEKRGDVAALQLL